MSFSISPWNLINSMKSVEDWQNTISANLNGATQIGYKQFDVYFGGGATTTLRPPGLTGAAKQIAETFIKANYTMIDFANGTLIDSLNWTDVAVDGEGFFMATSKLSNPSQDDVYFTRNGEWHIDSEGFLRSKEGLYILDGSQIPGSPNPSATSVPPWAGSIFNNWNDRERLLVKNTTGRELTADTVVELEVDTQNLFDTGKVQADLDDLRIGYWDGANWQAADVAIVDESPAGLAPSTTTNIRFRLKANLPANQNSNMYYLFYDNPTATFPVPVQPIGIIDPNGVVDTYNLAQTLYDPAVDPMADPVKSVEDWVNVQGTEKWSIGLPPTPSDTWLGAPAGNINYVADGDTGYLINGTNDYSTVVKSQVYRKWNSISSAWDFVDSNGDPITMNNVINGTNFGGTKDPNYDFSVDSNDLNAGKTNLDPTLTDWTKFNPSDVTTKPTLTNGTDLFPYNLSPANDGRWGDIDYSGGFVVDTKFDTNPFSDGTLVNVYGNLTYDGVDKTVQNSAVGPQAMAYCNKGTFSDVVIESDIKFLASTGNTSDWAGVQFRKTNAADDYNTSGYFAYIRESGSIDLYKAGVGIIASGVDTAYTPGVTKKLRIEATGANIKVFVDGVQKIDHTDATPITTKGFVSYRTDGPQWELDNFKVGNPSGVTDGQSIPYAGNNTIWTGAASLGGPAVISDDFSNGTNWTTDKGNLTVGSGVYQNTGPANSTNNDSMTHLNTPVNGDFTMTSQFELVNVGDNKDNISFQFNKTNANDDIHQSGYTVMCHQNGNIEVLKANGASVTSLGNDSGNNFVSGPHTVKIEKIGNVINVYVDGAATPNVTVTDSAYSSGYVGFRTTLGTTNPNQNQPPFQNATSMWKFDNFSLSYNAPPSPSVIDSQYLLIRQPIDVSAQGVIRKNQTITIDGLVDENVSVFIRTAAGALVPVYQDNTVGNNSWTGTFDQSDLTTGTNYIEVYASKDITSGPISTIDDWIELDMTKFQGYTAGEIDYTNGTGYSFTAEQLYLKPNGVDVNGITQYLVVKADGSEPKMEVLTGVSNEVVTLDSFGRTNLGTVANGAEYGTSGWVNRTGTDIDNYPDRANTYWHTLRDVQKSPGVATTLGSGPTVTILPVQNFDSTAVGTLPAGWTEVVLPGDAPSSLGNSLDLDKATNEYAFAPDSSSLDIGVNSMTMETWVYYTGDGMIVNKENSFEMGIFGGQLGAAIQTNNGSTWEWTTNATMAHTGAPPVIPLNTWTHIAAVYDGSSIKLFKNGVLEQTVTSMPTGNPGAGWDGRAISGNIIPSNYGLDIGARGGSPPSGSYFDGQLDEIRISDNARYSGNFALPTTEFTTDPRTRALYHLDDLNGTTNGGIAVDSSGNGNNLTLMTNGGGSTNIINTNPSPVMTANSTNQVNWQVTSNTDGNVASSPSNSLYIGDRAQSPDFDAYNGRIHRAVVSPAMDLSDAVNATVTFDQSWDTRTSPNDLKYLEYSVDGTNWVLINQYGGASGNQAFPDTTTEVIPRPGLPFSATTQFRWRFDSVTPTPPAYITVNAGTEDFDSTAAGTNTNLVNENFDSIALGSLPASWTQTVLPGDVATAGINWQVTDSTDGNVSSSAPNSLYIGNRGLSPDYDASTGRIHRAVTSNTLDMSDAAAINVSFDQSWDTRTSPNDLKYLEYSLDNGATWILVRQYGAATSNQAFPDTTLEKILPPASGFTATTKVRWRFDSVTPTPPATVTANIENQNFDTTAVGGNVNLINQNFDTITVGTLPGSWTQVVLSGDAASAGVNWQVTSNTDGNVASSAPNSLYIGNRAESPDYDASTGRIHRAVVSSVMDMTNAAAINVSFDQSWDTRTSPNDLKYLEYTLDGTNWIQVGQYGAGTANQAFPDTTTAKIIAPAAGFTATTQFRWRFDSTTATPPASVNTTMYTQNFDTTAVGGSVNLVNENFDSIAVGALPGSWTQSILPGDTTSAGVNWQVTSNTDGNVASSAPNSLYIGDRGVSPDYQPPGGRIHRAVTSGTMNMSDAAAINVSFDQSWDTRTNPNDLKYLEYSLDNGATWIFVTQYGAGTANQAFPNSTATKIVAPAGGFSATTKVRWRFDSSTPPPDPVVNILSENFNSGLNGWTPTDIVGNPSKVTWSAANNAGGGSLGAYFGNTVTNTYELAGPQTLDVYLQWGPTRDVDLHVVEPDSVEVYYGNLQNMGQLVPDPISGTSDNQSGNDYGAVPAPGTGGWDEHYQVTRTALNGATSVNGNYAISAVGYNGSGNVEYQVIADQGTPNATLFAQSPVGGVFVDTNSNVPVGTFSLGDLYRVAGSLVSPTINLSGKSSAVLTFRDTYETEGRANYDTKKLYISGDGGSSWTLLNQEPSGTAGWTNRTYNIPATYNGNANVKLKFEFDTVDTTDNNYRGWNIDDINIDAVDVALSNRGWNIDNVNITKETLGSLPAGWTQQITSGAARWQATDATDGNTVNTSPNSLWFGMKGDSPDDYNGGVVAGSAISPVIDLSGAISANVSFKQSYKTDGINDKMYLEYSTDGGTSWTTHVTYNGGNSGGFINGNETITGAGLTANTKFRFRFDSVTAASNSTLGWNIDDIVISKVIPNGDRGWNVDNVNISKETIGSLPPGWTQTVTSGAARWQATNATDGNIASSAPNSLWFGMKGDSPDDYNGGTVAASANSPSYDLTNCVTADITFKQAWNTESTNDNKYFEYSTDGGTNWNLIRQYGPGVANSGGFINTSESISGVGLTANTKFRFRFDSVNASNNSTLGWNIDDFVITKQVPNGDRGWNVDNVNISKQTLGSLPAGWTQQITSGAARWQVTDATDGNVARSTPNSLWFGMKGDSPDDYNGGIVAGSAISKGYDLSGAQSAKISFKQSWVSESGANDKKFLEYSTDGGTTWILLAQYGAGSGNSGGFIDTNETINGTGLTANTKFRFRFDSVTAANNSTLGWNIDDIVVSKQIPNGDRGWNIDNVQVDKQLGGLGGGAVHISNDVNFVGDLLQNANESVNFAGTIFADDGWTLNVKDGGYTNMPASWRTGADAWTAAGYGDGRVAFTPSLEGGLPTSEADLAALIAAAQADGVDTDGEWIRLYSGGGFLPNTSTTARIGVTNIPFNLSLPSFNFSQNNTILLSSIDGDVGKYLDGDGLPLPDRPNTPYDTPADTSWTGGWVGVSGFYVGDDGANDIRITSRTIDGMTTANRYVYDSTTKQIIDLFGKTGFDANYGQNNGSSQRSNTNHIIDAPNNASGGDDQLLYDYVPNVANTVNKNVYSFTNDAKAGLKITVDASVTNSANDSGKDGIQSIDAFSPLQARYYESGGKVYDRFGNVQQNGTADDLATTSTVGTNTDNRYMTSNRDGLVGNADDNRLIDYDPGSAFIVDDLNNVPIYCDTRLYQYDTTLASESRIVTDSAGANYGPLGDLTEGTNANGIQYEDSLKWNEYSATFDLGFSGPSAGKESYAYLRYQNPNHWVRIRYRDGVGIYLEKQFGGGIQQLESFAYNIADPINTGGSLKVEAEGRNYRVYNALTDQLIMDYTDNINPLLYGSFGFGANAAAWWDNLAITQIPLLQDIITLGDGAIQPNNAQDILDQLNLVVFRGGQGQNGLKYSRDMGSVYFQETDASSYAQGMIPGTGGAGIIYTNKLETSNVDMGKQVTHLASTKDVYDTLSKQLVVYLDNISSVLSLFR